jgi:hypothetical protein
MKKFEHNKPAKQMQQPAFAIAMDYRFEPNIIGVLVM